MSSDEQALPLVTVAVACYNQAQFVIEALESVKAQAYPNLHLVVLDDCSKDNSVNVIRNWLNRHYPDSVFVVHKTNMGVCRTANDLLANAKGKYLRSLAADDRWIPNTLARQIEIMEAASQDVGVLYSDALLMDERGKLLPKRFIEIHRPFAQMPEGWIFDTLLQGNFIPTMTAVIRLRCLEVVGGIDESLMTEDWDLWLRISRQFKFKYFPEPTAYYRFVQTSMTRTLYDEIVDSERRMFVKYLRCGWLAGEKKEEAIDAEYLEAYRAYRQGLPDRAWEAARAFRHRICIKHALLLLFVAVGLPFRRFEELINLLGNMNRRAKSILANRRINRERVDRG
jgi:glycosyltransferase involved in cell wall biosynthesis